MQTKYHNQLYPGRSYLGCTATAVHQPLTSFLVQRKQGAAPRHILSINSCSCTVPAYAHRWPAVVLSPPPNKQPLRDPSRPALTRWQARFGT
jgi:hypothetical protein